MSERVIGCQLGAGRGGGGGGGEEKKKSLAAIASAKTESSFMCHWLKNKLHSYLL